MKPGPPPIPLIVQCLQDGPCYGRVAQRTPVTVGKNVSRIGGQYVVEINANIRKLAKDRRGKTELRFEEIAAALMGQDYSDAARRFFADSTKNEADDVD